MIYTSLELRLLAKVPVPIARELMNRYSMRILLRLYNQINKADLIVSDMTGRNPNVFYETGYAHALNKKVILLTQAADDIPFDLKHYPHIVYSGKIAFLKDELQRRVQWYLAQPEQAVA